MKQAAFFRRFGHDQRGNVIMIVALSSMAVIGSVGLAVDAGRAQMAQNKLQNALDAAGLAAGATVNSADVTATVDKYLRANFGQGNLGATITDMTVTLSSDTKQLNAQVTATLPTTFMKLFGRRNVTLRADTEITRTNKGLELAMVLDTTGSMAGSKLASLKTASHTLVEILFGGQSTAENLWVGVVPFSQAVNIGPSRTHWLNSADYASRNWGATSWAGCVDARHTGRDVTDDLPSQELFRAYYWPDDGNNDWIQTTTRNGRTTTTYTINTTRGPNLYCPSAMTPLTNQRAAVDAGIDALAAAGNTHVNLGAVWGWRLISPRWRGVWGGSMNSNNLPLNYNTPLMSKAVIIMTDGENTMSNSARSAYWYLSDNRLNTTNSSTAVTRLNTRLTTVCNAMKAQGILVYTILFEENSTSVVNLMRSCATSPDYFFNSPDAATLQRAFQAIGDSLANLRISR